MRIELALLDEEPVDGDDVDLEPAADDADVAVLLAVELEPDVGGATAEMALTIDHEAAALAALLPWIYGRKETVPLLVS